MRSITCSAQTAAATRRRVAGSSSLEAVEPLGEPVRHPVPARRAKFAVLLETLHRKDSGTIEIVIPAASATSRKR